MIERDTAILKPAPQPYHSSLVPWQELMRPGDIPGRPAAIIGSVTGAFIRLGLIFLLAASMVALIWLLFDEPTPEPYAGVSRRTESAVQIFWAVLAVWHCAVGLVVVFAKVKFWQLQLLATIVNVPLAMYLLEYQPVLGSMQYWIFGYLDVWLVFLLARWAPTYKLVDFLNDEIHYYLID